MSFFDDFIRYAENNLVGWDGLKNELTNQFVNDATVTAQLQTTDGTPIGSAVTCSYIASSNGTYIGVLGKAVTAGLTVGTTYQIVYSVNSNDGQRTVEMVCRKHGKR